jgi:hypothetical protein
VIPPLQIADTTAAIIQYEIGGVGALVAALLGISYRNMGLLNRIKSYLENRWGAKLD